MQDAQTPNPVPSVVPILIVGAGPTGLTLACELARRSIPFRLIEATPGPQPGSRGKGVQPRSLEVFENLGIIDRVLAHGRLAMPMRTTLPDGTIRVSGSEPLTQQPGIPYAASLITPEWRIEEALRLRLSELGGAVEFGTALQSFTQTDQHVTARILVRGEEHTVTAQWLIGCDGGHSIVRKQAGIAFEGETLDDVRMIVADLYATGIDRDSWHMWSHAKGIVSLCPLPSTDLFQYQAGIAPGQNPDLSLANMQAALNQRSSRSDIVLSDPQWTSLWRANIRLVDRYRAGRVLLAGDAAHIHSPAGGQGMNTGIQDAHNLGWKLAAVVRGASPALLDTYEAERRPVAAGVLALSNARLQQVIQQGSISARRDPQTMQLTINYRDADLAHDDRAHRAETDGPALLRAGDRAPDTSGLLTTEGTSRLFDLLRGGRFTLLQFGAPLSADPAFPDLRVLHVVRHPPNHPDQIADPSGHLAALYGATPSTLLLIRPDGYIGFISDAGDAPALSNYLARLH